MTNQPTNELTNQAIKQPNNQPADHALCIQPTNKLTMWKLIPTNQPTNQSSELETEIPLK